MYQSAKQIYMELFETYKKRLKTKHLTWEAYSFERASAEMLSRAAQEIYDRTWKVHGYFPFQVYHPNRIINAPCYIDRIVEQWGTEKYIEPVFVPKLYEYNMACQEKKGPFLSMDQLKAALEEAFYLYGSDLWFYQFDVQGYFDNISHDKAKEKLSVIDEDGFWLYSQVVKSFSVPDGYAALSNPGKLYGFPKGNLPSQWTGIIYLSDVDWHFSQNPKCLFSTRYMDDGLSLYHHKHDCIEQNHFLRDYLAKEEMGVRLHPKKTVYAPISRGFTFCGWHYSMDPETGKLHIRIKETKKKEMEHRLKAISESVAKGHMELCKAHEVRDGMFEYLSHGTESNSLIRYMKRQYPLPSIIGS